MSWSDILLHYSLLNGNIIVNGPGLDYGPGTGPQRQEGGGGGYKMKKALRIFYFKYAVILRNYNFLFKVTLKGKSENVIKRARREVILPCQSWRLPSRRRN